MKIPLTADQRAQILAGASEIDLGEATPAAGAATTPATPEASATPTPAAPVAAASAPAAAEPTAVEVLTAQIQTKDAALVAAGVEIATLKAAAAATEAALPGLLEIAKASVGQMQVALSKTNSAATMSAADLVAEYKSVLPVYQAKLPVGGVASTTTTEEAPSAASVHPLFAQRLATVSAAK